MDNYRVGKKKIAKQPCLLQHPKETKKEGKKNFRTPEREGGETFQTTRKRGRGKKIKLRVNE